MSKTGRRVEEDVQDREQEHGKKIHDITVRRGSNKRP